MISLQAEKSESKKSLITFTTASETQNAHFSIERSADSKNFTEIGQVRGAGDSYETKNYTFTDENPLPGKNYYRLRQVDFDGAFEYSEIVVVDFGSKGRLSLSPNPVSDAIEIKLAAETKAAGRWQILDFAGRLLREGQFEAEQTALEIAVADLPAGAYQFRLQGESETMTEKFVKQ